MSSNLFHVIKDQLSDEVLEGVENILKKTFSQSSRAIDNSVSGILNGLSHSLVSSKQAELILKTVINTDDHPLEQQNCIETGLEYDDIINSGIATLIDTLGHEKLDSLIETVSSSSDVDIVSTKSLLGFFTPTIFSLIKRELQLKGKINLENLQTIFADHERDNHISFSNDLNNAGQTHQHAEATPRVRKHQQPTLFNKVFPIALSIATVLLGYNMFMNTNVDQSLIRTASTPSELRDPTTTLKSVIQNITSSLETITDQASAKAALPQLEEATVDLERLSHLIKQLPDSTTQQPFINMLSNDLPETQQMLHDVHHQLPEVTPVLKLTTDELLAKLALLQ